MNKRKSLIVGIIFLVLIIAGLAIYFAFRGDEKNKPVVNNKNNFIYLGSYKEELVDEDNYVFSNYDDYKKIFTDGKLTTSDFENNNYVLIPIRYDICSESNIKPISYNFDKNKLYVNVEYEAGCGVCPQEYMYYLLKIKKDIKKVNLKIDYKAINKPNCNPNVSYKPLIYLYPLEKTNVSVKLGNPSLLTTTYPVYNDGWNITALPNGVLTDSVGRKYYGLYWEGLNYIPNNFKDGFVVKKEDLISFLESKLKLLGLTDREANEFIIYWLPILEKNEYNLIRFESIDEINKQMPLEIHPAPDTIIRVFMEYKPLNKPIKIKEQQLSSIKRKGFTVVEWGGTKVSSYEKSNY